MEKKKTNLKTQNNKQANKKQTKKINKKKRKKKKIIQLLTAVPELVTLDCSLTHVLQVPNTQTYHS